MSKTVKKATLKQRVMSPDVLFCLISKYNVFNNVWDSRNQHVFTTKKLKPMNVLGFGDRTIKILSKLQYGKSAISKLQRPQSFD